MVVDPAEHVGEPSFGIDLVELCRYKKKGPPRGSPLRIESKGLFWRLTSTSSDLRPLRRS